MIKIIKKDITTVTKGIVGQGVNCLAVMGAGVALAIAKKWPKALAEYKQYLGKFGQTPYLALGMVQLSAIDDKGELIIANCFTQVSVGYDKDGNPPASLSAIEDSLRSLVKTCNIRHQDLYTPQIGCGLGGLDWETQVKPIYEKLSEELDDDLNWYVCTI